MKVVVIRCRETCKTLNLKINSGLNSGTSYNKFLFNDFHFPSSNYNTLVSVTNEFFTSVNTLRMGDTDLRFYITTVQDG